MATHKLLLLPGDGIGPEVMAEVKRLIDWLNAQGIAHFETDQGLVGGAAYDASKLSITDATMATAQAADAVIFGAVGGPKWDSVPYEARPEAGLLRLRKDLGLFANLRPAVCYPALSFLALAASRSRTSFSTAAPRASAAKTSPAATAKVNANTSQNLSIRSSGNSRGR